MEIIHLLEEITMAKQTIKTRYRVRKVGKNSPYRICNMCHGTGRVKKRKHK